MGQLKLNDARYGVELLSGLMQAADEEAARPDGKVSKNDIEQLIANHGDGATLDAAVSQVHKYAQAVTSSNSPTIKDINKALGTAMKAVAKADLDKSGALDDSEQTKLAETWKAIVAFAIDYKDRDVTSLLHGGTAP
jgi:hypothetical protein